MGASPSNRTRAIVIVLINLASLGFLVWTLRDISFADLKSDVKTLEWPWIGLAVAAEIGVYLLQAIRWQLILLPVTNIGFRHSVRAIFVGLFASEALPVRGGELLRCYMVTRWTGLPYSVSISSALIEREFDGLWLWLGLGLSLKYVDVPKQLGYVNDGLGVVVLAGAIVLGLALFSPKVPESTYPPSGWKRRIAVLINDLARIGHSRYLWFSLGTSVVYLLLQAVPVWALFQGYGFDVGIDAAFALMVVLRLGSIVPQAPASLGLFPFLTKVFLVNYGVGASESGRFALILWAALKLPVLIGGAVALAITGAKMGELTKAAEETHSEHQAGS